MIFASCIWAEPNNSVWKKEINVKIVFPSKLHKKLIFNPSMKYPMKLDFPKLIYSVNKYTRCSKQPIGGRPISVEVLRGNRYAMAQIYIATGGSFDVDNLYLLDMKTPRAWHLASVRTGSVFNTRYFLSPDKKNILCFDTEYNGPVIVLAFDSSGNPYIKMSLSHDKLKKMTKGMFNLSDIGICDDTGWDDNENIKLVLSTENLSSDIYAQVILNIDSSQIKGYKKVKCYSYDSSYVGENLNIDWSKFPVSKDDFSSHEFSHDKKYAQVYYSKTGNNNDIKYFLQIIRMKDYKIIYSADAYSYRFSWFNANEALFLDTKGRTHILKIKEKGNIVEDWVLKNIPHVEMDSFPQDIISEPVNSEIAIVAGNNLYLINSSKMEINRLTDFTHKLNYSNGSLDEKKSMPLCVNPIIDKNTGMIFYSVLKGDNISAGGFYADLYVLY